VSTYGIAKDVPCRVTFQPVTTGALRLEVQLPRDFSVGIWEWLVK
jgi:hypothetical protein